METIDIDRITLDFRIQARADIRERTVDEYSQEHVIDALPPVVLHREGETYWIADGWHRVLAHKKAGRTTIVAHVYGGDRRTALFASISANTSHGLPQTNADKRRAVSLMLADPEWATWSDNAIAKKTGTGNKFVGDVRRSLCSEQSQPATRKGADGRTIDTSRIGRKPSMTPQEEANADDPRPARWSRTSLKKAMDDAFSDIQQKALEMCEEKIQEGLDALAKLPDDLRELRREVGSGSAFRERIESWSFYPYLMLLVGDDPETFVPLLVDLYKD